MKMSTMCFLNIFLVFITLPLVEVVSARDTPPIIIPDQGTVMGTYMNMYRTQKIMAYLGIPYAMPPINERRFAAPAVDTLPTWDGVRNATFYQPDCWQNPQKPLKKHDELFNKLLKTIRNMNNDSKRYDEDCLFLNIFIPDGPAPMEGYAVIVWLHSGDFSYGSASDLDPFQMVFKQKVVVVTVAYRLNIFGFLTSMDGESPGNFGLMDQSAALLWVKRNIQLFSGNEKSITLMGHGAGAISVGLHLVSGEWTEGLFHRAIVMSGSPLYDAAVKQPSWYASSLNTIANSFGCFRRPTSKLLECLRHINAQILAENVPFIDWGPIIDSGLSNTTMPFVPDLPVQLIDRGQLRQVPLLIGYTNMEEVLDVVLGNMMDTGISSEMYDSLITDMVLADLPQLESNESCGSNIPMVTDAIAYTYKPYPPTTDTMILRKKFVEFATERKYVAPTLQLANWMSKSSNVYAYRFDINPRSSIAKDSIDDWVLVPHNYDLIFVWGIPYWYNPDMVAQWESTDKRIADIIMILWANFVKSGNPTKLGVSINWDEFSVDKQNVLVIDRSFNMSDEKTLNFHGIKFWNDYFPKVVDHAMHCCNMTDGGSSTFYGAEQTPIRLFVSAIVLIVGYIFS